MPDRRYDPENKALEALETERDNLRVELAAARRVIAAGYGTCSTCAHWTEDEEARDEHQRRPDLYRTTYGNCAWLDHGIPGAWAYGWEVDGSGFHSPPDFGCVAHVKANPSPLSLPALEVGEASVTVSRIVVTEHPFPIVYSNHLPAAPAPEETPPC